MKKKQGQKAMDEWLRDNLRASLALEEKAARIARDMLRLGGDAAWMKSASDSLEFALRSARRLRRLLGLD